MLFRTATLTVFVVALGMGFAAHAESDQETLMEAAKRYESTVPVEETLNRMAVASLAKVSGKQREKLEVVYDTLDKEQIREDILELMATHFSEKELNALAEFYGSPVGQSLSEKFPEYLLEANKVFQRSFFDALVKINGFKDRPDLAE